MAVSEQEFLNHIAQRLNRPRVTEKPQHPFRGAPDFWLQYELSPDKRIELFMENWQANGGIAKQVGTMDEVRRYIVNMAQTMKAKYMIRFDHPILNEMKMESDLPDVEMTVWNEDEDDLLAKAAGADIGIAVMDYAIGHTGTAVVLSASTRGRSVSLLPTVFVAIIRAEDVKTRMGEVMKDINLRFGTKPPAGIHFISGPSRSADIENDLTIGVHGPGIVHALIV